MITDKEFLDAIFAKEKPLSRTRGEALRHLDSVEYFDEKKKDWVASRLLGRTEDGQLIVRGAPNLITRDPTCVRPHVDLQKLLAGEVDAIPLLDYTEVTELRE